MNLFINLIPNRKFLLSILVLFIFIDLVLLFFYINKLNINIRVIPTNNEKTFIDSSNIYTLSPIKPLIKKEKSNIPDAKNFLFTAFIAGKPFIDNKYGGYVLPLKLNTNSKNQLFFIVFGSSENKIPVLFAKNGFIPDPQQWELINIKNTINFFKINDPIIFDLLNISDKSVAFLQKDINCVSESCLQGLRLTRQISLNTESLYNSITENKPIKEALYIGYPSKLILYD